MFISAFRCICISFSEQIMCVFLPLHVVPQRCEESLVAAALWRHREWSCNFTVFDVLCVALPVDCSRLSFCSFICLFSSLLPVILSSSFFLCRQESLMSSVAWPVNCCSPSLSCSFYYSLLVSRSFDVLCHYLQLFSFSLFLSVCSIPPIRRKMMCNYSVL